MKRHTRSTSTSLCPAPGDVSNETHEEAQPRPADSGSNSSGPAGAGPDSGQGPRPRPRERSGQSGPAPESDQPEPRSARQLPAEPATLASYGAVPIRPAPVQDGVGQRDPVQTGLCGRPASGSQRPLPHRLHLGHTGGAHELVGRVFRICSVKRSI